MAKIQLHIQLEPSIGVNAAAVAGVAIDPHPTFDLQGSSCVDDPQHFDKCFIFSLQRNF